MLSRDMMHQYSIYILTATLSCKLIVATSYRVVSDRHTSLPSPGEMPNFYLRRTLNDGEVVTHEHWRGRWTVDTVNDRADNEADAQMHRGLIRLVQSTNGHYLVVNIYDAVTGELVECDIVDKTESINQFITEFIENTTPILNNLDVQPPNATVYHGIGGVRDAKDEPLMQFGQFKRECRIYRARTSTDNHTDENSTLATAVSDRSKRASSSMFISPGTQWCGLGSRATDSQDVSSATDRCCRRHDQCPYYIEGMSQRFGYFNYRFYTMSYCEFHACLKAVNSGTSNMVGKVFFNVVNRSCFKLRRDRLCAKRSWFGVCNKYRRAMRANIANSLHY